MDRFAIAEEPADSDDVRWCSERYYLDLGVGFGYDVDTALPLGVEELTRPSGLVLGIRDGREPAGCGAVKLLADGIAEIERMWVSPSVRGHGLGGRMLDELELPRWRPARPGHGWRRTSSRRRRWRCTASTAVSRWSRSPRNHSPRSNGPSSCPPGAGSLP